MRRRKALAKRPIADSFLGGAARGIEIEHDAGAIDIELPDRIYRVPTLHFCGKSTPTAPLFRGAARALTIFIPIEHLSIAELFTTTFPGRVHVHQICVPSVFGA